MWNIKVTIAGSNIGEGIRLKGCQRFVDVKQDVNMTHRSALSGKRMSRE